MKEADKNEEKLRAKHSAEIEKIRLDQQQKEKQFSEAKAVRI